MLIYRLLLLLKFIGVVLFAGGLVASALGGTLAERRRAVHKVASPGLLLIWISGYFLADRLFIPISEAWIVGGFALSLLAQLGLAGSVAREPWRKAPFALAAGSLLLVLALMVFRPTWGSFAL
jgi:hypothetical protein